MTIIKHEWKQNRKTLLVWSLAIAAFMVICIFMFPEMSSEMGNVGDMFSSMGSFTEAFGMDRLNFGEFIGFYSIECGNILGIGGAFFAALVGIAMLAKEEKEHTAEFLMTHPISRRRVVAGKLGAAMLQIVVLNAAVLLLSVLSILAIGEEPLWSNILLIHLAYFIMQVEVCAICFGISAFLSRGGLGIGLGLAIALYFLNIIANLTENAKFLKYITPFGYTEAADIVSTGKLEIGLVLLGLAYSVIAIFCAFMKYERKDIH